MTNTLKFNITINRNGIKHILSTCNNSFEAKQKLDILKSDFNINDAEVETVFYHI